MGGERERIRKLRKLLNDKRPKGRYEILALERALKDLEGGAAGRGFYWDEAEAERRIALFGLLKHWKGEWAGRPFMLEEWQSEGIIAPLFGWKRADGTRRFRTAYCEIARKNGKTTIAAGVGINCMIADREPGAEVYSAATKRDQAAICFKDASHLVKQSEELLKRIEPSKTALYCDALSATFQPLSKEHSTLDGLNVHCAIIDEYHAHRTSELFDILRTATGARRQPMMFIITTAGHDKYSPCWREREYAASVLEELFTDDSYFAFICAADEEDDWTDERTWFKANPNLCVSKKIETMREECEKAKRSPANENTFRRLHLNQWTEQETRYIPMDKWEMCDGINWWEPQRHEGTKGKSIATKTRRHEGHEGHEEKKIVLTGEMYGAIRAALRGRRCWAGLDLSSRVDLTALSLVFAPMTAEEKRDYELRMENRQDLQDLQDGEQQNHKDTKDTKEKNTGEDARATMEKWAMEMVLGLADCYMVLNWFFIPEENMLDRQRLDRVPYDLWAQEGFVIPTPGNVVDLAWVKKLILGRTQEEILCDGCGARYDNGLAECPECWRDNADRYMEGLTEEFEIVELAFDRWGAVEISTGLMEAGMTVVQFGQGFASMSSPTKEILNKVLEGRLVHWGHPVLTWNARSVTVVQDAADNVKPVKPDRNKSANRIDGMVSLIMGFDRATRGAGGDGGRSVYEKRGIIVI